MTALLDRARLPRSSDISRYTWFFAAFAYVLVMSVASTRMSWDIWAGIAFAPILFAVTIPLLKRGLRKDPDPRIGQLVVIAFVAKMFGAAARYALTYGLYERADASEYHESGARLATAFWDGTWAIVSQAEVPELSGTPFIRLVTGLVYVVTKPTIFGGFVIFSWLSFLGLFFFYKAIVVGFPEANHRRYAYLVFFLPSMLYWPSSIGKEAWISFGLGLASYGVALILRHQPLGYPVAGLGLLATAGPRPHITVLCVVVARNGLRAAAPVVERLDARPGHQGRGHRRDAGRRGGGGQQGGGLLRGRPGHLGVGHVGARLRRPTVGAGRVRVRGGAREVAGPVPQRLPGRAVPPLALGGGQRPGAHRLGRGHLAARAVRGVVAAAGAIAPVHLPGAVRGLRRRRTRSCS